MAMSTNEASPSTRSGEKRKRESASISSKDRTKKVKRRHRRSSGAGKDVSGLTAAVKAIPEITSITQEAANGSLGSEEGRSKSLTALKLSKLPRKPRPEKSEAEKRRKREKRKEHKRSGRSALVTFENNEDSFDVPSGLLKHNPNRGYIAAPPSAGRLLQHDPAFAQDDQGNQYLLMATPNTLQLLSLDSSLVVRTYTAPDGVSVVCFAVDRHNGRHVHIAHSDGNVSVWDWTADSLPGTEFSAQGDVRAISTERSVDGRKSTLFYISTMESDYAISSSHGILYRTKERLFSIQILDKGEYVVCGGPSCLIIGMAKDTERTSYVWNEVPLISIATCVEARFSPGRGGTKGSSSATRSLDFAIGHADGRILLYSDVSSFDRRSKPGSLPSPRILHWHRDAVSSIKFSADEVYLISGGREPVLLIWQLETGKRQELPHLAAAIESIVINPEGNRYAVQLGNNSILVLSTSELKPVAWHAGLASIAGADCTAIDVKPPSMAGVLDPSDANRLVLSVPATQPRSKQDTVARPFLQTFDLANSREIRRQAVAENFVTEINIAPDGSSLVPLDISKLALSRDGTFLATVGEWTPRNTALHHLAGLSGDLSAESQRRLQIELRFWGWSKDHWAEQQLLKNPHSRDDGDSWRNTWGIGNVVGLAADPASDRFATVGQDGIVKIWSPRRIGGTIEGWKCRTEVALPHAKSEMDTFDGSSPSTTAVWHLAYSTDGSLLAVAYSKPPAVTFGAPNRIDFIDTNTGEVHSSKAMRSGTDIRATAFLGRYYIALATQAAYVWDFVEDQLMYKAKTSGQSGPATAESNMQLAANQDDMTFAIVIDNKVILHDPRKTDRLHEQVFEAKIDCILSARGCQGYKLVFDNATIRSLSIAASTRARSNALSILPAQPDGEDNEVVEEANGSVPMALLPSSGEQGPDRVRMDGDEDSRRAVTAEQLADVCGASTGGALPAIQDMFWDVMALCARKPLGITTLM